MRTMSSIYSSLAKLALIFVCLAAGCVAGGDENTLSENTTVKSGQVETVTAQIDGNSFSCRPTTGSEISQLNGTTITCTRQRTFSTRNCPENPTQQVITLNDGDGGVITGQAVLTCEPVQCGYTVSRRNDAVLGTITEYPHTFTHVCRF